MKPNVSTEFSRYVSRTATGLLVLEQVSSASPISMYSHGRSTSSPRVRARYLRRCYRVRGHQFAGLENLDEFPRLKAWFDKIEARPAVQVGLTIPKAQ